MFDEIPQKAAPGMQTIFDGLPGMDKVVPKKKKPAKARKEAITVRLRGPWTDGAYEDIYYPGEDGPSLLKSAQKRLRETGARGSLRKIKDYGAPELDRIGFSEMLGLDD